jgi:hypothetical protein
MSGASDHKRVKIEEFVPPNMNRLGGIVIGGIYMKPLPKSKTPKQNAKKQYRQTIFVYIHSFDQPQNKKEFVMEGKKKMLRVPKKPSKEDVDNQKATEYHLLDVTEGRVWSISIPIEDIDMLRCGDYIEINQFKVSWYEGKIQGNGNPSLDKAQGKSSMFNFFMEKKMITHLIEDFPFDDTDQMQELIDSYYSQIIFLRRDEDFATQVDIADPAIHDHLSIIQRTFSRDVTKYPKSWAYGEAPHESEILSLVVEIFQSPIGPTKETFDSRAKEGKSIVLYSKGYKESISIFGLDDVDLWKTFGTIFFAEQTSFPFFAAVDISARESDAAKKSNKNSASECRAGTFLFFYADVVKFYKRIAIPISEKNVSFLKGVKQKPIGDKIDVVRVDAETGYRTDSLKTMPNVTYRAIVNFSPFILKEHRQDIENMSVDTGDKLFEIFTEWNECENKLKTLERNDPAFVFIKKIRTSFRTDPVVVPFALIDRSAISSSAQTNLETIGRQLGMKTKKQHTITGSDSTSRIEELDYPQSPSDQN